MRFRSLGSGSRGNATLLEAGGTRLLVDCGFSLKEFERRLKLTDLQPSDIDAILVTHEHGDHVRGVGPLARKYGLPVWSTGGTWRAASQGEAPDLHQFSIHGAGFRVGEIKVEPYAVPHDAREPSQYVFEHRGKRFGMLTDVGTLTPHIVHSLAGIDALLLESNHDLQMLADGPYPPSLQARVGGRLGHLNNGQAAELLGRIDHEKIGQLVIGHLSEQNNHPDLARSSVTGVCDFLVNRTSLLAQDGISGWFEV